MVRKGYKDDPLQLIDHNDNRCIVARLFWSTYYELFRVKRLNDFKKNSFGR